MGYGSTHKKMSRPAKSKKGSSVVGLASRADKRIPKIMSSNQRPAPSLFMRSFFSHVMDADLENFSSSDRERIANSIWHLAQNRSVGVPTIRVFNPSNAADGWTVDHTVIEIVNDDMPFLVDSVTSSLQRLGFMVHLVIHPVMLVERNAHGKIMGDILETYAPKKDSLPESWMHIQIDHCLDGAQLKDIEQCLHKVLSDVRAAVEDWRKMRQRMHEAIAEAVTSKHQKPAIEDIEEIRAFMQWLDDNNFTYLGFRDIDLTQKDGKLTNITVLEGSGLGILRDTEVRMFGGLRDFGLNRNPSLQNYVRQNHLLVVTKTNQVARVHRSVPMDAIFIRRFNKEGDIIGERLFVGLFTSQSYSQNPLNVPFLRHKITRVIERAGLNDNSHDGKLLVHILNNYPHDELFQISEDELFTNSLGILQLQERARVALFTRRDAFDRFVTCLIYAPRDHWESSLRVKIQSFLESEFQGHAETWNVRIDDSILARAFVTINLSPSSRHPDLKKLEKDLTEMCRDWSDRLRESLVEEFGEATALSLLSRYGAVFPTSYREIEAPRSAVGDIRNLERSKNLQNNQIIVDLSNTEKEGFLCLKLFQVNRAITLSEALPLIENMGLKIEYMSGPFEICSKEDGRSVFIHKFIGRSGRSEGASFDKVKPQFEEAFSKVWVGDVENDSFNALTIRVGMTWQEVRVLRAFARYLRQLRIPYSHEMMATTFLNHPNVAQNIYALFYTRHNPDAKGDRAARCREIEGRITEELSHINVLEEDRIIRRYLNLVQSSLRTNFFQVHKDGTPKSYLSIKFDSRMVEFMPLPKPLYEIFVYSPRVEAVHLRGGKVARGGIRWSDRREDFRNEILGLMKAQMVKNSVIVPVGSKGGFIVKHPPTEPDKYLAEGIACYRIMMCGLLDITDNRVGNKIVPPERVVRHDLDDPYLVVAADKGTAKFSDIANGISQEYGFWLDDAFASGGSAGYDHKGMGITARGAWEAIKRHFREMGKDIQTTDFTVVGVGDMSGDVFGNGVLLSKHIQLIAAFDHRHIFCDPSPDAAISFAERRRLFDLPRSSWADYDAKKISRGGGVFSRSEKLIKITPEMKKVFGITADSLTPADLIQFILKADVELLYFGGIGTYIKASIETHEEVGDRATEALRVDGAEVRAKVIGEGANLGVTQRGRVEFALKGGRINTDAIDNSAGVDTSDHEVNIKILLRKLVDKGSMKLEARNKLLSSMTTDVGKLVLLDNYNQTQALSIAEAQAADLLKHHERCMQLLEKTGLLNRAVEYLPVSNVMIERRRSGKGLTRPELAVLLAYAKIWLYQELLNSSLPDDDYLQKDLVCYFPEGLHKKYTKEIAQHQLNREIIATAITNSTVNRSGIHTILLLADSTGADPSIITRAFISAREVFKLTELWDAIEALDNRVPARIQTDMLLVINKTLLDAIEWFLNDGRLTVKLASTILTFGSGVERLAAWLSKHSTGTDTEAAKMAQHLKTQGVPEALAQQIATLPLLVPALDLTRLTEQSGQNLGDVAEIFFSLERRLGLDWLKERFALIGVDTPSQKEAVALMAKDLLSLQQHLTVQVMSHGKKKSKKHVSNADKIRDWLDKHAIEIDRYDAQLNEWHSAPTIDLAVLTLATRFLKGLLI